MSVVYLGIGSNIGDKKAHCEEAVNRLNNIKGLKVTAKSSFYVTKPVGGPPQEDYLNGVIQLETDFTPKDCLKIFKDIEKEMGRRATAGKNHPRLIDIDILLYDDRVLETRELVIPHPRMHERHFVLRGLAQIAPDLAVNRDSDYLFK